MGAESEIDIAGRRPVSLVVIHKKVTMNFVIRKASSEDSGQVFSLVKDFATSFKPERSAFGKSFNHLIFDESALVNVCVFEGEIVAYSLAFDHYTFYANGRVTWVEEVMVREELRGKEELTAHCLKQELSGALSCRPASLLRGGTMLPR